MKSSTVRELVLFVKGYRDWVGTDNGAGKANNVIKMVRRRNASKIRDDITYHPNRDS